MTTLSLIDLYPEARRQLMDIAQAGGFQETGFLVDADGAKELRELDFSNLTKLEKSTFVRQLKDIQAIFSKAIEGAERDVQAIKKAQRHDLGNESYETTNRLTRKTTVVTIIQPDFDPAEDAEEVAAVLKEAQDFIVTPLLNNLSPKKKESPMSYTMGLSVVAAIAIVAISFYSFSNPTV